MQNNESNSAKSKHGYSLNDELRQLMSDLLNQNKIKKFQPEPRYNYPLKQKKQFSPDGEITLNNGKIIIYDNTTTVRHDRLKQKLWDAYGTKEYFKSLAICELHFSNLLNIKFLLFLIIKNYLVGIIFLHNSLDIKYYLIIPNANKMKPKEVENARREKGKINDPEYYSTIDDIITVQELINIIEG